MRKYFIFFLFPFFLFAEVDYDCVVVGTSPTAMFEAIYQTCLGKKVLVVEQSAECGGAWKSIDICGVQRADMGCHEFGNRKKLKHFLSENAGCTLVNNTPSVQTSRNSWSFYPSKGCFELIHNLTLLMHKVGTTLLLNHRVESVFIDKERELAILRVNGNHLTTSKIIVTSGAEIHLENLEYQKRHTCRTTEYPHIYLLISDPTPPKFTYINHPVEGCSRAMNMTQYVGLEGTGMQLIAFQVRHKENFDSANTFLTQLQKKKLVAPEAKVLKVDQYIYEQWSLDIENEGIINTPFFDIFPTDHIGLLEDHIEKWKGAMKPWNEMMSAS